MTDRDRLVKIVRERWNWRNSPESVADALLAEGMTLPPQPAGPVTSEEAMIAYERAFQRVNAGAWFDPDTRVGRRVALDAAMPLLVRDHGLLTREEVERRAREWAKPYRGWMTWADALSDSLVTALTASGTSAASTREAK